MVGEGREVILQDYASSLEELKFSAKHTIDALTAIAKENTDVADGIVGVIKNRINKSIPDHKLPALFLLDSICKTVGNPYNILVGDDIFQIFSNVYVLVNDKVRQKLKGMFETWKTTNTKGTNLPLFPREQMDKIENFLKLASNGGNNSNSPKIPSLPLKPSVDRQTLTNARLIQEVDILIPGFESQNDSKSRQRMNALKDLRLLLSSRTLSVPELQAVQTQLNGLRQQLPNRSPGKQKQHLHRPHQQQHPYQSHQHQHQHHQQHQQHQHQYQQQQQQQQHSHTPSMPPKPPSSLPPVPIIPHQYRPTKGEEIFNLLLASGLVQMDQSLVPGSKPSYSVIIPKLKYQKNALLNQPLPYNGNSNIRTSEYESLKHVELSNISLESNDLQKFVSSNIATESSLSLLYNAKPSKCGTCGKRFSNDTEGVEKRRLHLDWHFRINKKLGNGSATIVQSRNWYLDDFDWVEFKDENLLEYATYSANIDSQELESNMNREIPYVVIPTNETNMINKCQICHDQINATYDDDSGEWRWVNCIRAPGEPVNSRKIFHATCFNETHKKRGAEDELKGNAKRERV